MYGYVLHDVVEIPYIVDKPQKSVSWPLLKPCPLKVLIISALDSSESN